MKGSESSSSDSDQLNKISEKESSKLTKELNRRKKAQDKKSIARSAPLKVSPSKKNTQDRWRTTAGNFSEEEQKKAVQQAIEVYSLLPASSTYAKHKLKVLNQALQLLEAGTDRSQEEADQLQQLLQDLKL
jgi:hypothetical protein